MKPLRIVTLVLCTLASAGSAAMGAVYYVATTGNDINAGTEAAPWKTIQHAADTLQAGDTVLVQAGAYDERVSTVRGGTADNTRIVFQAAGTVTMRGFLVNHPYVTLDGFDITGHSDPNEYTGYVMVAAGGDRLHLLNNTVRDGIYAVRTNVVFSGNTATSTTGGFLAAGLRAGQRIYIGRGSNTIVTNAGTRTITTVTDTSITVTTPFTSEGPVPAYITGSYVYGLVILSGVENCLVQGNTFTNLSYDTWFIEGTSNIFKNNILTHTHGWDAMHFMGSDHVFEGNFIHTSPLVVYQVSPDVFENYPNIPYARVLFQRNFVIGFAGVLASQKGIGGDMDTLTFRNNVFVDVGRHIGRNPNIRFENNTFLYAAATNSPMNSIAPHPIKFEDFNVEGAVIRNNIFVGCGQLGDFNLRGWYEFANPPVDLVLGHNFVSGPPAAYAAKSGFNEGTPSLNGGDPGFVDIGDPLGPDGLPFTDDDGLRLRSDSKLRGAGAGGVDLGAYNTAVALEVARTNGSTLSISWPDPSPGFVLQAASAVNGLWTNVSPAPVLLRHRNVLALDATNNARFFRLFK